MTVRKRLAARMVDVHKARRHRARKRVGQAIALARVLQHPRPHIIGRGAATRRAIVNGPATRWADQTLGHFRDVVTPHELAFIAEAAWAAEQPTTKWLGRRRDVRKATRDDVARRIADALRTRAEPFPTGAMAGYLGLADAVSTEAGQMTLDSLGINETWRWTGVRDVVPDLYQARGSKIIQGMYGAHINQLASIAAAAANPAAPYTIAEVSERINNEWAGMQAYQVDRIARTETAIMWETTAANTYTLNDVQRKEWIDAGAEDELCLDNVADGIIAMDEAFASGDTEPPAHPNCVCDILPVLENEDGSAWLPPAEPFTGNVDGLPLVEAPMPGEAIGAELPPVGTPPLPGPLPTPAGIAPDGPGSAIARVEDQWSGRGARVEVRSDGIRRSVVIRDARGRDMGNLYAKEVKGRLEVMNVNVDPSVARQHLASDMADILHEANPDMHLVWGEASDLTPEGRALAESLPPEWNSVVGAPHAPPTFDVQGATADLRPVVDEFQTNARKMFKLVETDLEDTGLVTRWDGTIRVGNAAPDIARYDINGLKAWECFIGLDDVVVRNAAAGDVTALKTIVHEFAHSFSAGMDRESFMAWRGYEEGVAEGYAQALTGGRATTIAYTEFIEPLESARIELGTEPLEFYRSLIRTPVAERQAFLEDQLGHAMPDMPGMPPAPAPFAPQEGVPWYAGRDAAPRWVNLVKNAKLRTYEFPDGGLVRVAEEGELRAGQFVRLVDDTGTGNFDRIIVDRQTWDAMPAKTREVFLANESGRAAAEDLFRNNRAIYDLLDPFRVGVNDDGAALYRLAADDIAGPRTAEDFIAGTAKDVLLNAGEDTPNQALRALYDTERSSLTRLGFQTNRTARLQRARIAEFVDGNAVDAEAPSDFGANALEVEQADARAWAVNQGYGKWAQDLHDVERAAVNRYTQLPFNDYLRANGGVIEEGGLDAARVEAMDTAIARAPALTRDLRVFRLADAEFVPKAGQPLFDDGYLSTTVSRHWATDMYAGRAGPVGDTVMEIIVPEGTQAAWVGPGAGYTTDYADGVVALGEFPNQYELILPRGGGLEFMGVKDDGTILARWVAPVPEDISTSAELQAAVDKNGVVIGEKVGSGINNPNWGDVGDTKVVVKAATYGGDNAVKNERAAKLIADYIDGVNVPNNAILEVQVDGGVVGVRTKQQLISQAILNPDGAVVPTGREFGLSSAITVDDGADILLARKRLKVFDYLIGNHDRHASNFLVQTLDNGDNVLWAIDQESMGSFTGAPGVIRTALQDGDIEAFQNILADPVIRDLVGDNQWYFMKDRVAELLDGATIKPLAPAARVFAVPAGPADEAAAQAVAEAPIEIGEAVGVGINDARWGRAALGDGKFMDVVVKGNREVMEQAAELFAQDLNEVGGFGINIPRVAGRDMFEELGSAGREVIFPENLHNAVVVARVDGVVNGGEFMRLPVQYDGMPLRPGAVPLDMQADVLAQRRRIQLFDRVLGNIDRNAGNWLVNPDTGEVWAIDHGIVDADISIDANTVFDFRNRAILGHGDDVPASMPDAFLSNEEGDILRRLKDDLENPHGALQGLILDDRDIPGMLKRVNQMLEHNTMDGSIPPPPAPVVELADASMNTLLDERMAVGRVKAGAKVSVDSVNDVKWGKVDDELDIVIKTRGKYGDWAFGANYEGGAQIVNDALGEARALMPRIAIRGAGDTQQILVARIDDALTFDDVIARMGVNGRVANDQPQLLLANNVVVEDMRGITMLDNIIGNTDRHMGNVMFKWDSDLGKYRAFAIDHGITFDSRAVHAVTTPFYHAVESAEGVGFEGVALTSQEREALRIMLDNWDDTAAKLLADTDGGSVAIEQVNMAKARAKSMYESGKLTGW